MFVFVLDFSLWPIAKIFIQAEAWDLIGFISFFFICVFSSNKLSKIRQFGNAAQRNWEFNTPKKHETIVPHNHWKKGWAMIVFLKSLPEKPPYTRKKIITGYCKKTSLMTLVYFQRQRGGVIWLVMFGNEPFKRLANVMLICYFTWETLRSHTGVCIFGNSVNAWERRGARVIFVLLLVLKLMRIFLIATFQ